MFKVSCMCGEREKNFKFDIGEKYRDKCCREKGYLADGSLEGQEDVNDLVDEITEMVASSEDKKEVVEDPAPEAAEPKEEVIENPTPKDNKVNLKDMKPKELKEMAMEMGLDVSKVSKKKDLIKLIKGE